MIRQPIVTVLGHVDHGKTSLLDFIRKSRVQAKEHGGITQHIGATEVPADFINEKCGAFFKKLGLSLTIPGLLFIDTPGHEAFMNLRKRGGSLADIAILVIDITQGFQPQTVESLEIMKQFKVPFVIAANKIDLVRGWNSKDVCFASSWQEQNDEAKMSLENYIYEIMGIVGGLGFDSDRFDRISDFTKQVAIVPICARTGEGVMDLLAVIAGLAQRFLQKQLHTAEGPGRGTVLEVKQEKGLGTVMDCILYDGNFSVGNEIVVAGMNGILRGKIKLLLKPKPLDEMRDPTDRFDRVHEVRAAAGVRIVAQECEDALAGSMILSSEIEDAEKKVMEDVQSTKIVTDGSGIVLKADALGSLEAIAGLIKKSGIKIRLADIGPVSQKDVVEAENALHSDPLTAAVIAFNVNVLPDAEQKASEKAVKIIRGGIIYKLIEEYREWVEQKKQEEKKKVLEKLTRAFKFKLLPGYVFRQNKPAIVGVEVLGGVVKPGVEVMNEKGKSVGHIKALQDQSVSIPKAERGASIAVSIEGPTVGRQINEGDTLYSVITEPEYKKLKEFKDMIAGDELVVIEEIKEIFKRIKRKTWGM